MTFVQIDILGIARLRYLAATNITMAKQGVSPLAFSRDRGKEEDAVRRKLPRGP